MKIISVLIDLNDDQVSEIERMVNTLEALEICPHSRAIRCRQTEPAPLAHHSAVIGNYLPQYGYQKPFLIRDSSVATVNVLKQNAAVAHDAACACDVCIGSIRYGAEDSVYVDTNGDGYKR